MKRVKIGGPGRQGRQAEIGSSKVYLPNAISYGYCERYARPGMWISWASEYEELSYGRVLGKIEDCDSDGEDCTGYIAVLWLHSGLSCASVRWIDPKDVKECRPPSTKLLAFITSVTINAHNINALDRMAQYGSLSDPYLDEGKARFEIED